MALNVADEAVAVAALAKLYENYLSAEDEHDGFDSYLVAQASKVQFQPSTRRLVMTFDLAFGEPAQGDTDG